MPSWKKVIVSGSEASVRTLFASNSVTSSIFSGSQYIGASFTGSLLGTASFAATSSRAFTSSFALTSSFINPTGTNAFIQGGNSFGTTATLGTNDAQSLVLETNGTPRITLDTAGNTNIATGFQFSSGGTLNWGSGAYNIGQLTWDASGGANNYAAVYAQGINNLRLGTTIYPTAIFVSGSNGYVGIGTATPAAILEVSSNAGRVRITQNTAASTFNGLELAAYTSAVYGGLIGNQSTGEVRLNALSSYFPTFYSNGLERVRIGVDGNVGIGTTSPTALLDVAGGINSRNTRVDSTKKFPIGHYAPGETVFELDPIWTQAQMQDYMGSTAFTWNADSTAPGGYCIQVDGAVNVGNVAYSSGFPFIPTDTGSNDWYYMECWIRNEAGSVNKHYMGGIDYNESFVSLGGNPGSFTYNVMNEYNPGTAWTKVFGYWNGFGNGSQLSGTGNTNNWEVGTKYFGPQALFNYINTSGTARCYISGWKIIRVSQQGNRYFQNNVLVSGSVGIGTTSPSGPLNIYKQQAGAGITSLYIDNRDTTAAQTNSTVISTQHLGSGVARTLIQAASNTAGNLTRGEFGILTENGAQFVANFGTQMSGGENAFSLYTTTGTEGVRLNSGGTSWINGGNVGIGTTSPAAQLHLSGAASIRLTNNVNPTSFEMGLLGGNTDANAYIYQRANASIFFGTNNSTKVTILGNGNVGINTTSPAQKLEVQGDGVRLRLSTASSPATYYFDIESRYDAADTLNMYGAGGANFLKWISNTNALNLQPAGGNVGIGTTTPYDKLEVNGAIAASGAWGNNSSQGPVTVMGYQSGYGFVQAVDWGSEYKILALNPNGGNVGIGTTSPQKPLEAISNTSDFVSVGVNQMADEAWTGIHFGYREENNLYRKSAIVFQRTDLTENNAQGKIHILNGPQTGTGNATLSDARLTIGESGNVGINNTSPTYKLDIVGASVASTTGTQELLERFKVTTSNSDILEITNTRVSTGTDWQTAGYRIQQKVDSTFMGYIQFNGNNNGGISFGAGTDTGGPLNVTEKVRITGAGDVCIGATSALGKLDVAGTTGVSLNVRTNGVDFGTGIRIQANNANGGYFYMTFVSGSQYASLQAGDNSAYRNISLNPIAGNVGIGQTNPTAKLHIASPNGSDGTLFQRWDYANNPGLYELQLKQTVTSGVVRYNFSMINSSTAYNDVLVLDRGSVGMGTTDPAYKLDVLGTIRATGDIIAYSDARVKDNVQPITNALEKVVSLRGVSYTRKDIDDKSTKIGLIAQEVLSVLPEVVSKDNNGNYSVSYGNIVGLLIEAIKEQQKQIDELKYLLNNKKNKK